MSNWQGFRFHIVYLLLNLLSLRTASGESTSVIKPLDIMADMAVPCRTSGSFYQIPSNTKIPKECTINMTIRKVTNTHVFSERDFHFKKEPFISQSSIQNGTPRFSPHSKPPPSTIPHFLLFLFTVLLFCRSDFHRRNTSSRM